MAGRLVLFNKFKETIGFQEFIEFIKEDWDIRYNLIFIFLGIAISLNYYFDIEDSLLNPHDNSLLGIELFFVLNLLMFSIPLLFLMPIKVVNKAVKNKKFWTYLLVILGMLSALQSIQLSSLLFSEWHYESYFNRKIGSKLSGLIEYLIILIFLGIILGKSKENLFGLFNFQIQYKPYIGFLVIMLPLILLASTQEDFLKVYPKLKQVAVSDAAYYRQLWLYEPIYLLNFIGLEWFFRGFLVLFLSQFLDTKSIVLVAILYCSFHFGKPLMECISSFFGGYVLGYMVYKSKSIWGGVLVHMGIAFLMDCAAFIAISG